MADLYQQASSKRADRELPSSNEPPRIALVGGTKPVTNDELYSLLRRRLIVALAIPAIYFGLFIRICG